MNWPDTFKHQIRYPPESGCFISVDREASPAEGDWVMVEGGRIEKYYYQKYVAVVTVMDFCLLQHSEQY